MLINLKVKTLDAQTHEFSVDNEITVRQFKDKIAERTNIAADQQRIIYCGRVLADEKQLKEYDVDGKVVHVAERPPPSQRGPSTSSAFQNEGNARERPPPRGMRNSPLFRALDGMVVGTMAIPMNASMNNPQVPTNPFTSSSSFCMNRITVARHMLDCVNNIAAYLEDPERGLNNTSLDILARGRWTMESTVVEVGITAADLPQNQNIVEMVQGAVSAALRRNGNTNVTVVQLPTVFGSNEGDAPDGAQSTSDTMESSASDGGGTATVIIEDVIDGDEDGAATDASSSAAQAGSIASNSSSSTLGGGSVAAAVAAADGANNSTSTGTNTDENPARRRTGTNILAEVVEQMRLVQARLNPFVQQFYDLLQNEPTFEENDSVARENAQRLFDRVSEAFHYMSHAQHAISDLMLDVSQPTPRYLTCRPILVEQSGYVSSNNYLTAAAAAAAAAAAVRSGQQQQQPQAQTQTPQLAQRSAVGTAAARESSPTATSTETGGAANGSTAAAESNTDDTVEDPVDDPIVVPIVAGPTGPIGTNAATQSNDDHTMQMARLIHAVVNSAPIDTEFHVQINAPSIVSFGVPMNAAAAAQAQAARSAAASATTTPTTQQQQQSAGTSSNGNEDENASGGESNATSPTTANAANTASPRGTASAAAAGVNQARVTTATLPTTSTQTRSTSRPQLQIGNIPAAGWNGRFIPANMMSSFDRFLPCNSHHIRDAESATNNGNGNGGTAAASAPHNHNMANAVNQRTIRNISDLMQRSRPAPTVGSTMTTPRANTPSGGASGGPGVGSVGRFLSLRNLFSGMTNDSLDSSSSAGRSASTTAAPAVTAGTDAARRNLRTQLLSFLNECIFEGGPINENTIPPAINRAVHWFGESLLYLPQYEKPEYDSRDSVFNILRRTMPLVIDLLSDSHDQPPAQFEQRLKQLCEQFMKRLYSVLFVCVGRNNAEMYWGQLMRLLLVPVRSNFRDEALQFLCVYINSDIPTNADTADAQQFIVQRNTPSAPDKPTPMDTDIEMVDIASTSDTMSSSQLASEAEEEETPTPAEPLPDVVAGSETWHRNFPNEWLPIITRDIQTQAESPPVQAPFSDAYISGMSAKRRKMIQSTKPPTDARSLVADSVRKAIQNVGVTTSTASNLSQTPDEITSAIASDGAVQASFTEAVRTNVRERLKKDPDYKTDKYPQINKFVNK